MAIACLAKISPLNPATGSRTDVHVSSVGDPVNGPLCNGLGGLVWEPAMLRAPSFTINLWNGDFIAPASPGAAAIAIAMEPLKKTYAVDGFMWIGAPVTIYADTPGTAWPWAIRFVGTVTGFNREDQTLTIRAEVDESGMKKNILTATYAGTGGAEGGADIKNRLKPLVMGWAQNVEPVLIDATNSVYQFSGYGAIEEVTKLYERGSDFGAAMADYADYTALVAATITPARWATCLAAGMVRLGAPQAGVITGDIKGHKVSSATPRLTGAVISALATIAGVSSGVIETATLTALDSAFAANINIVLTEQETWLERAQKLALACNRMPIIGLAGKFMVNGVAFGGTEVLTLNAQGSAAPQVKAATEQDVSVPYFKTVIGASESHRVHTFDEISSFSTIIDRGRYEATDFYREGNIVDSSDGSRWIYTNAVPGSGNAPPNWPTASNSHWDNLSPPLVVGKSIEVSQTTQIITYDGANALSPSTQTNTFAITRVNATGTCNWTLSDTLGNTLTPATYLSATSGDSVTMTAANFSAAIAVNGAKGLIVTATVVDGGSITDAVSVFKLQAGSNALVGFLTNESVSLAATSAGTVSSFATATGTFKVFLGTTDVTASCTFAETTETNCTGTVNATSGVYSVSALSADNGEYVMTATYSGTAIVKTFSLAKAKAGTNGSNGATGATGSPGAPGAPGADAVTFYQSTTPTATAVGQIWYNTSDKIFRRWDGSTWVVMLGDLSALNTVATTKIDANAVTLLTSAYTQGAATFSAGTWTAIQTITFTATGAPVAIKANLNFYSQDTVNASCTLRIMKNGSVNITGDVFVATWTADFVGTTYYITALLGALAVTDTPSAGSVTYTIELNSAVASSGLASATTRYLEALETKR